MNIVLAAGKRHGVECLQQLIGLGHRVLAIFGRGDDPHELADYFSQLKEVAGANGIPFYSQQNLNTPRCQGLLRQLQPELMIVIKWRRMIGKETYSISSKGCVILHDSLLPKYRGFAPANWAIINGESETGATLFFVADSVDSGPIIGQRRIAISPEDTIRDVEEQLVDAYLWLLRENLPALEDGTAEAIPQDETQASYGCPRTPEDGRIDWARSAVEIHNFIRALTRPYPGAFAYLRGQKVFIWDADLVETGDRYVGRIPGRVVQIDREVGVQVLTGGGIIRVKEVQLEGLSAQNATDLISSIQVKLE